jgi:photosystem II stability/assembly factor-like uncharacterized protein
MAPKDRGRERRINLFSTNVLEFPIQNKVVAFGTKVYSGLFSEKDKGKDVPVLQRNVQVSLEPAGRSGNRTTYLSATVEEELVRINSVANGATDKGEPVEHNRGLIGVLEEDLSQNIPNHSDNN